MIKFIGKYWKIGAALVVVILLIQLGSCASDYIKAKYMETARAQYQAQIDAAEADKQAALAERDVLAEKAGQDREDMRLKAEAEKRKSDAAFAILASESAAKLRARNATIAQVLIEKEKDEFAIIEAKETIDSLAQLNYLQGVAWRLSDERIEVANKKAMDALTLQFVTCQQWSAKLEKKLKPTFWGRIKQYGIIAGAFAAGRVSAAVIK